MGGVGVDVGSGVEVGKAVGIAVWVRALLTIAKAVFCTFVISISCSELPQAVSRARKIIQK